MGGAIGSSDLGGASALRRVQNATLQLETVNREDTAFGSKAGEKPPFMLAINVYEARRDAISNARVADKPVRLTAPAKAENLLLALNHRNSST